MQQFTCFFFWFVFRLLLFDFYLDFFFVYVSFAFTLFSCFFSSSLVSNLLLYIATLCLLCVLFRCPAFFYFRFFFFVRVRKISPFCVYVCVCVRWFSTARWFFSPFLLVVAGIYSVFFSSYFRLVYDSDCSAHWPFPYGQNHNRINPLPFISPFDGAFVSFCFFFFLIKYQHQEFKVKSIASYL